MGSKYYCVKDIGIKERHPYYEVAEDGTRWWCKRDFSRDERSSLTDNIIEAQLKKNLWEELPPDTNVATTTGEETKMAEMETEKQASTTYKLDVQGWKVGGYVKWTGPVTDAREWGEVKEVNSLPPYIIVQWEIGKTEAYLVSGEGFMWNTNQKKYTDTNIVGERLERKPNVATVTKRAGIAGGKPKDVEIVREGTQIILPPGMTLDEGITWLTRKKEADEKEIAIYEVIEAYPLEGAYAFKRALDERYGFTALVNTKTMFGEQPPTMIGIEVGLGKTEQIPWGRLSVPGIAGYFETGIAVKDGEFKFIIGGKTKQKHKAALQELTELTRHIARERSIYKGQAIRVKFLTAEEMQEKMADGTANPLDNQPKFIDLAGVNPDDLIFPEKVADLVDTAIMVPITKRERCKAEGVPFKRGVLLEGPWGVGKTLTANVTAKRCVEHGTTFIYLENVGYLEQALKFAALYAPAVVFAEDIDQVARDSRFDEDSPLNTILNTIDGVELKHAEVMVVLTTNYINDVEQAMLRPGRIDAVIPVRPPDAPAVERLIRLYSRGRLGADESLAAVSHRMTGQIPAVIREMVERAKLEAIGRVAEGETLVITSHDLERAAESMLMHLELLRPRMKDERSDQEKAAAIIAKAIESTDKSVGVAQAYVDAAAAAHETLHPKE